VPDPGQAMDSAYQAELRRAQLESYASQTPINAVATIVNTMLVSAILSTAAPGWAVALWTALQVGSASLVFARWFRRRRAREGGHPSPRAIRRAIIYALIAGINWGLLAPLLGYLDDPVRILVVLVAGGMIAGAATTLGAIPRAAAAFIFPAALPFVAFYLAMGDPANVAFGTMGLVYALAMAASARTVYRGLSVAARAQTESARLLAQLEAARRDWLEIAEATDGYALYDEEHQLVLWNENYVRFLSLPVDQVRPGAFRETLAALGAPPVREEPGDRGVTPDSEGLRLLANGRWLRSSARRTARGNLIEVHTDVTALKEAERKLVEREAELLKSRKLEAIGTLAAGVAHDFNNLLTVIQGHGGMLETALASDPGLESSAAEVVRAARRGAAMTRQLLAFSRTQELVTSIIDLRQLLAGLERTMENLTRSGTRQALHLPDHPLWVRGDISQLERVVTNLCLNASDAMPNGGELTVSLAETERAGRHWAILEVRDTGTGIAPTVREHLFEPFFTTKAPGEGTGLGLATAYGIVAQSDGMIEVDSTPGAGSTFRVLLPMADPPVATPGPAESPSAPPRERTILLVEDDPNVLTVTSLILRRAGFRVLEAPGPEEGLRYCREHRGAIDLILSDVVMPGMHGPAMIALARRFRPETPVHYVSGYTQGALAEQEGVHIEPGEILLKPFTGPELLAAISRRLAGGGGG
jgi:signal transduction histidine kinase/CheY-like chemotaxis protein